MRQHALRMRVINLFAVAVLLSVVSSANGSDDAQLSAKVERVFSRMSEADKVAELQGIRPNELMVAGRLSLAKCRELIPHGIGHLCQFASSVKMPPTEIRDFVRGLQHWLMTETPARLPAFFHDEALTGFPSLGATTFPQGIGMGCTWDPDLTEEKARFTAETFRAAGATFALSPMLDLCRNASWPRLEESFGEDPYLTSAMGLAFVKGLQGNDLRTGIAATCKHFAGYGGVNTNRQEFIAEILMPHEVAIKLGGAQSVMPGYHSDNGIPCIANHDLLTGILRGQLGFDGLIISDYGAVNSAGPSGTGVEKENTAAKCINAGADVELCQGLCFPLLPAAVKDGKVSQKTLDDAVRHSLMLKARIGLLDDEIQIGKDGPLDFDPPAHRRLAYQAACESLVLLKNNGILPLKNNVKKIALVGPNAGSFQALLGDYTYQSLSAFWWGIQTDPEKPKLVTLLEGLKSRVGGGITILHERGCDWSEPLESKLDTTAPGDPRLLTDFRQNMARIKRLAHAGLPEANLSKALQFAAESDVVIAAMGENVYLCGEGRDRKGIRLPGEQEAFVQRLLDTGKPVILVLFGGRQQVIDTLEPRCAAVVQAWFPGEEGGNAVADLLLGRINPSGKLCVSYPKSDENRFMCYNEGYRVDDLPMYPFGYGLSYTRYAYRDLRLPSVAQTSDEWLTVSFKVKNAGQKAGTEIVQLYVSPQGRSQPGKPIQLKAFRRVELGKGKERLVTFKISPQQLAYFSDGNWVIEPGKYEIMVAASSVDVRLKGTIELTGEKRTMKSRSIYFADQR